MRQLGVITRVLLLAAISMLAACGSSSSVPPSTTQRARPTTTTRPAPPTTRRVNPVAADQLTQLVLDNALAAAKSIYGRTYDFTAVTSQSLGPLVANVHFGPLDAASKQIVGVLAQDRNDVLFVTQSASGRWYCVTDNDTDGVSYGTGPARAAVDSNGECQQPGWPAPGAGD